MVDTVGYKDDLIKQIREDVQEELMIVRYQAPQTFVELLMGNRFDSLLDRVFRRVTFGQSMPTYVYP